MRLNLDQCAELIGCTKPTVKEKVKRGLPFVERGARGVSWVFDAADVLAWEKEQAVASAVGDTSQADETELKRRKLAAETAVAEIEAAKARGLVADLATVEREWASSYAMLRARMMQIPGRVASSLLSREDEREIKTILGEEIELALQAVGEAHDEPGD
jgi:phage terminase Nu1 subunit (DNA packaging protein)